MPEPTRKRARVVVRSVRQTRPGIQPILELERRERQLAALYELWRVTPELEMPRILDLVAERAVAVLDAHSCSLLRRERGTDVLRIVASVGLPGDVANSVTMLVGERIAGRVAATRQPILVNRDPNSHPMLAKEAAGTLSSRPEIESSLCAPILGITNEVLGVLCLSRHVPAHPFTESDLRVFSLFAALAGAVVAQRQTIDDLTKAAKEQAQLERDMERQAGLAAMGQFAAMVAHEMRNPLGSIKGAAQYLLQENQDPTVSDFLNIVVEEVDGLGKLTTDLLDFARPTPPLRQQADLVTLVRNEVAFLRDELVRMGASTVREEAEVEQAPTLLDSAQIGRALRNLLLNAAQATATTGNTMINGEVTVRVAAALEPGFWQITVDDNGPGLPDTVRERLWEPFFTTKARGTGLGLAQVKRTIEAHGGKIQAENKSPKGARFTLLLPIAVAGAHDKEEDKDSNG